MHACRYIYIEIHIHPATYIQMLTDKYLHIDTGICIHTNSYKHSYIYIYMYTYNCIYIHICIYIYIYIYIYMYIQI
jgi:hypothetical protein